MRTPLVFAALLTLAAPGFAATMAEPPFLAKAAQGDMAEVKMGKLAKVQGHSAAVKAYGQTLVTDHGAHAVKVAALAKAKGVKLPTGLDTDQTAAGAHLAGLKGADFDAAFKAHMIEDHQKDIADYTAQASSSDADIAGLANATLPVLKKHLALAEAL